MTENNHDSYRHFYLYAKGWYKESDLMTDLASITAERCCCDIKFVTEKDIISVLTHAVEPHIDFAFFMNNLMDNQWFFTFSKKDTSMNILLIRTMLTVLLQVNGKDIPWLGSADKTILPLKETKLP